MHPEKCSDGFEPCLFYLFESFYLKKKTCLVVLPTEEDIETARDGVASLSLWFRSPARTLLFNENDSDRISTLYNLKNSPGETFFILASRQSVLDGCLPPEDLKTIRLQTGANLTRRDILSFFTETGWTRTDFVEDTGQFAVRGEIIDAWSPPSADLPVRILFSGDTVESIRRFDPETQLSKDAISGYTLLPAKEYDVSGNIKQYLHNAKTTDISVCGDAGMKNFFPNVRYAGNIDLFFRDFIKYHNEKYTTVIFCGNTGEHQRLTAVLQDGMISRNINIAMPDVLSGKLRRGFYNPERKLFFISYNDIFGRFTAPPRTAGIKSGVTLEGLWEIAPGDYVVHEKYGIGRYKGLKQIAIGENVSEYIQIEYRGGDRVFVPITDFRKVGKYIGVEGRRPKLYSLDTASWERAKLKAKESASDLAKKLHGIYLARKQQQRPPFTGDAELERALANSFPYDETQDQINSIEQVQKDMGTPYPMDRLVLGDVGFGKTEVAVRAAFRCAVNSKQAAVLTPTTVLAEQHYNVFMERLKSFPVHIALLTRFQTKKEQAEISASIKRGITDIVIGTHRLLQKDIRFKDLGLLIIDEEHRFGVAQKEHLKLLRKSMDVLSLTATPIPRTLSMSLSGIKDLSLIETSPEGRLPIETHLAGYNKDIIVKAISSETGRGGQVFYIHNYIHSIEARKRRLEKLMPGIKFCVVHGRMKGREIEKTMFEFGHALYDCLIATTIVESGIDLPNVNTMIVEKAEKFGLSTMYQLRGRVGRSKTRAYCYLLYTHGELNEATRKRLAALKEFSRLGSGFKLALQDMEIRGAGEFLGKKQHGFVHDVGLDIYSRFLSEEVHTLRGIKPAARSEEFTPVVDIDIPAFIPQDYIPQEQMRIMFYRKFITAEKTEELNGIIYELTDRFGSPPGPVKNLVYLVEIRHLMKKSGLQQIKEIYRKDRKYLEYVFLPEKRPHDAVHYLSKTYNRSIAWTQDGFLMEQEKTQIKNFLSDFIAKFSNI